METSRRDFLKGSALLMAGISISPSIARSATITNSNAATSQPFESGWEFYEGTLGGPWEAWHLGNAAWHPVQLPHCFNHHDACDPDRPAYRGQGWYRIQFSPQNPLRRGRTLLHFGGAGQRTTLFAGSHAVGEYAGGYTAFAFDITDGARNADGAMQLSVLCDSSRDLSAIPSDLNDFNLYGGLYRHVNLLYVPEISMETVHVRTDVTEKRAKCSVHASLYNPSRLAEKLKVEIEVFAPDQSMIHHAILTPDAWDGMTELTSFTVENPSLWSPSSPSLYRCVVRLTSRDAEQISTERFGLRYFEFLEHGPFLLNGKKLFLRGTQRHEDDANHAAAVPDEITRQEMHMIREMGANFIRLAHYPQSDLVLDLCDELGLIVWEELPWSRCGSGDAQMREMAFRLLRTMISQHYNHPSIVFWSLGNEEDWPHMYPGDGKQTVRGLMQQLQNIAHETDPSRLTSCRRCKPAMDIPDVYSPSIWDGWYHGKYQDYQHTLESYRDKIRHFLHMEWGADSLTGRHEEEPYGEPYPPFASAASAVQPQFPLVHHAAWSETYACDLFDWYLKTQETLPWFAGSAQWIFKDFSTPLRPMNPIPRVNQKGLVERSLNPKEGYYVFQSYWSEQPMVHIYGHSWPVRWGRDGQPRLVRVYSNCESVELFLNGKSCGIKHRNAQDFPCAGLRWELPFKAGENTLRAVGSKHHAVVSDQISLQYQTQAWGNPASLTLRETKRSAHRITVEAQLLDASGILCLDARQRVRFRMAGSGSLIDNLGTASGSRVVELANGRAEISFVPENQAAIISVSTDGAKQATLQID